jgi:hypothetical protein
MQRGRMVLCVLLSSMGASAQHLALHDALDKGLVGKVKIDGGAAPPGLAAIDAVCGGVAYPLGFADADGDSRWSSPRAARVSTCRPHGTTIPA